MLSQGRLIAALGVFGLIVIVACGLLAVFLLPKTKEVETASSKHQLQEDAKVRSHGQILIRKVILGRCQA